LHVCNIATNRLLRTRSNITKCLIVSVATSKWVTHHSLRTPAWRWMCPITPKCLVFCTWAVIGRNGRRSDTLLIKRSTELVSELHRNKMGLRHQWHSYILTDNVSR